MKPSSSSSGRINPRDVRGRVSPTRSQQLQRQQQQQQLRATGINDSAAAAASVAAPPPPPPPATTTTSSNVRSSSVSARATARIRQRGVQSSTVTPPTLPSSAATTTTATAAATTLGNVDSRQSTSSALSNIVGRSSSSLRQRSRVGDTTSATTMTSGNTGSSSVKVAALSTVNQTRAVERATMSSFNEQQQQSNQPRVAWIDEKPTTDHQLDMLEKQRRQQEQQEVVQSSNFPISSKSCTPNSTVTTRKGGLRSTLRSTLAPPSEATSLKTTIASRTATSKVSSTTQSTLYTKQYNIEDKYNSISGDGDDDYDNVDEDESSWKFVGHSGSDDNTNEGDDGFNSNNITNTNVPTSSTSTSLFATAWDYQQQEEINFNNDNHQQQQQKQEYQQQRKPQLQDENPPPATSLARMKMTLMKQQELQQQTKQKQQDVDNDRFRDSIENVDDENSSRIAVTTIEDLERLMEASTLKFGPTDSSCILDNSVVMIKSYHTSTTMRLEQKFQDTNSTNSKIPKVTERNVPMTSQTSQLSCSGFSLGTLEELFTLTIQNQLPSKMNQNQNLTSNGMLRYGDNVVLKLRKIADKQQFDQSQQFQQQEKLIVYVRQIDNDSSISSANDSILDACSDDSEAAQIDNVLWTIIRFRNTHPVRIGMSATRINKDKSKRNQNNDSNLVTQNQPVRYGEPILFRHNATGGILSCEYIRIDDVNTRTKLSLVTDSYDVSKARHTIDQSSSLLSRLQQSDLIVPSTENAFAFCPPTTPPVPSWALTSSNSKSDNDDSLRMFTRPYLDGSYLYQEIGKKQQNPQLSPTIQIDDTTKYLQSCRHAITTIRDNQMLTAKGQEFLLVDQALGTLLGLEGDYVKAVPLENSLLPIQFLLRQNKLEQQQQQPPFDPIVQNLITSIVTLSTAFARVRNFVNQHFPGYEYGSIMHAMCEELDKILQEYQSSTVVQLQNEIRLSFQQGQPMALRKLLIRTNDSLHMMNVLERICTDTKCKKGGALINSLTHLGIDVFRGNSVAEKMVQRLLDAASIPYMSMLIQWMETGELDDPDAEFMVRKVCIAKSNDIHQTQAMSWESIYELAPEHVLDGYFGTTRTVEQVLTTGRYWNALRMCSDRAQGIQPEMLSNKQRISHHPTFNNGHAVVSSYVKDLYRGASSMLMTLLFDKYDLFGSLRLIKRYFLIEHGDIFVNFLDVAESELQKDLSQISRGRVQNWLNGSVQITERNTDLAEQIVSEYRASHRLDHGTSNQNDGFRFRQIATISCLRCRFATSSLTEYLDELHSSTGGIDIKDPWTPLRHTYSTGKGEGSTFANGLSGLETFFIEFADIPFPISLVLTPRAIAEYQLLFRHLFFAKHVERRLVSIWQDHQFMKELQSLRGTMGQTFLLRQRMLHFMQNLIYYMMFEVIEPNWIEMEESIMCSRMDQTVDDIVKHHDAFLRRALDACLLTNRGIVRALTKLMRTCLLFTDQMRRFLKATKIEDDRISVAGQMQKVVQRKMNDRRHSMDVDATDRASRKLLRTNIQKARIERQQRVHRQTVRVQREVSSESYQRMVHRFEEVFSDNLREFMTLLTRSDDSLHTHKVNLCIRLDYNGYVSRAII